MSTTNTTTEQTSTKANRKALGLLPGPIAANRVYSRTSEHNFQGQTAVSWILLTPENQIVRATTYDGNLGKKFNLGVHNTEAIPADEKVLNKKLKGYTEAPAGAELPAFINLTDSDSAEDTEEAAE